MQLKTPQPTDVANKTVIVRVDYNVPLKKNEDGSVEIRDDRRIKSSLETIQFLLEHNAKVVLMSHLGRPKSPDDTQLSLAPIAVRLRQLLSKEVIFIPHVSGVPAAEMITQLPAGAVALLENLRFDPREKKNDPEFARELASLAEVYINDAFSASHRAHASTEGITQFLPAFAGKNLEIEVSHLAQIIDNPEYPLVIVLGGAKISDKVGSVRHLATIADIVLIGGATANNFLAAEGLEVYRSFLEEAPVDEKQEGVDYVQVARDLIEAHKAEKMLKDGYIPLPKILTPIDVIAAPNLETTDPSQVQTIDLSRDMAESDESIQLQYLDIGPKTSRLYSEIIAQARTIFWNGPMGVWENSLFAEGTREIAQAVASNPNHTVIGGGDTISAVDSLKPEGHFEYVSTAGGATLEFLSGDVLPGIKPLIK